MRFLFAPLSLLGGSYFHLWYLSSMIIGLLVISAVHELNLRRYLMPMGMCVALISLALGSYSPVCLGPAACEGNNQGLALYLLSISFLSFGLYLGQRPPFPDLRMPTFLALSGLILQVTEARFLQVVFGVDPMYHCFLIGTIPFAIGMLGLGVSCQRRMASVLSSWGREHSLGIYIVHPLWIPLCSKVLNLFCAKGNSFRSILLVFLTFGLSLFSLLWLQRVFPTLSGLLKGDKAAIQNLNRVSLAYSQNGLRRGLRFWPHQGRCLIAIPPGEVKHVYSAK